MKKVRSRIHEFFSPSLLKDMYRICDNPIISDNNEKVTAMIELMRSRGVDFVELGPGTNRLAILIDNYVFKIALDKWGLQDNLNEFTTSQELQPYVVKTYETNELLSVCEYVTVISKDEFNDNIEALRNILSILADGYLLGDVGTVPRNFANWGYRDNGDLVILDFAYIYRVDADQLVCSDDQTPLEYDENYYNLRCPKCHRKYTFMDVRRRVTREQEKQENELAKQLAYKLSKKLEIVDTTEGGDEEVTKSVPSADNNTNETYKEETEMGKHKRDFYEEVNEQDNESMDDSYLKAMQEIQSFNSKEEFGVDLTKALDIDESMDDNTTVNTVEIHKETPNEISHIRLIKKSKDEGNQEDLVKESADLVEDAKQELIKEFDPDSIIDENEKDNNEQQENEYAPEQYDQPDEPESVEIEVPEIADSDESESEEVPQETSQSTEEDTASDVQLKDSVQLRDEIRINRTVTVDHGNKSIDAMRASLRQDAATNHAEELAADYANLQEEAYEEQYRKPNQKKWK